MTDIRLPERLREAIEGVAGSGVRQRAATLSGAYRARQDSQQAVAGPRDVDAYLLTRMPATYAAVATVLAELAARWPAFSPRRMLDAGAGAGAASWAAAGAFPDLAEMTLIDRNLPMLDRARELAALADGAALRQARFIAGDLGAPPAGGFDLVVASYSLTELEEAALLPAAAALWAGCRGVLAIVEPGRPADHARLMRVRAALLAAGGRVLAPCPHGRACPLPQGDWCHFGVRLPRSRAHRQAKGASLGYEDEKFSYLVLARDTGDPAAARLVKAPLTRKFEIGLELCTREGLETRRIASRDGAAFKAARKLGWGDALD